MIASDGGVAAPKRSVTADEFYDFVNRPENEDKWFESIRGEVVELPPPTRIPGTICNNVAVE